MTKKNNKNDIVYEDDFNEEENSMEHSLEVKIKKIKDELKECKKERQEYLNGWQRARADFTNQKIQQVSRENKKIEQAQEKIFYEILPVVDSFHQAMANKNLWEQIDDNWRKGVEYIYNQLLSILKDNNILEIPLSIGDNFDPINMESLEIKKTTQKNKNNTVAEILKKGYMFNGKIIRPSIVNIYKYNL